MAKKSPLKASKPKAASMPATEMSPLERAAPVAAGVQLKDMLFDELHAGRSAQGFSDAGKAKVESGPEHIEYARSPDGDEFMLRINFTLRIVEGEAVDFSKPDVEIRCRVVLVYKIQSLDGISDEQLFAFGQTSGVFTAWPYWREYVHSTSYRLSVPPILLPTYRI